MGFLGLSDDTWIVPETFGFLSRCFQIMAMCCILCSPAADENNGSSQQLSFSEWIFILSCSIVFFLNCLEFIGPVQDNMLVQVAGVGIGLLGLFFLYVSKASDDDLTLSAHIEKYYASIFGGLGMTCCALSATDFYVHLLNQK